MKKNQKFFMCEHCGNVIRKMFDSGVPVVCCGENMQELIPNTVDASVEKHLPVLSMVEEYVMKVEVGSVPHPMTKEHFIAFIYIESEGGDQIIYLDEKPSAEFCVAKGKPITVYAYCNLHGLWKTEM